MLQKKNTLIWILYLGTYFCASSSLALIFPHPAAMQNRFEKHVLQKNQITYSQWYLSNKSVDEEEVHPQVVAFSQHLLERENPKSPDSLLNWASLREAIPLNKPDREILLLLAEKIDLDSEYCRYLILEQQDTLTEQHKCLRRAIPLAKEIRNKLAPQDLLVIDGKVFHGDHLPNYLEPGSYQWKIISDRYVDYTFTGTPAEFEKSSLPKNPWVSGPPNNYQLNNLDPIVVAQSEIFFDENLIKPAVKPETQISDWIKEHRGLLIGLGIIVGGVASYQLRDKTLVITRF